MVAQVVRLHQELTAARSEVQLHDGGLTATSDQPRVRELEQSVMALQTELASLKAAGDSCSLGGVDVQPATTPSTSLSMMLVWAWHEHIGGLGVHFRERCSP